MTDRLTRAWSFEEALRDGCADRLEPTSWGTAVFTPSLPRVWDLNVLRVERDAGLEAVELAAEAERLQAPAGLAHRRVLVPPEALGLRLAPGFAALGWKVERLLLMDLAPQAEPPRPPTAREVDRETLLPLRRHEHSTVGSERDEETTEQLIEWNTRLAAAGRARYFAAYANGDPVACADLYSDGRVAQIEDVYTHPDHRGAGHGRAVASLAAAAARDAGHELVFLVADDEDWPKELYGRLGFRPLGRTHGFLRTS